METSAATTGVSSHVEGHSGSSGQRSTSSFRLSAAEAVAGATAGFAEHFTMFPFDTIKTRMQAGSASSVADALRRVWRMERLTHLYRGCVPVLVSAVPAHAAYFGTYEAVKRTTDESAAGIGLSACAATVAHDTVSTPFDVIKQRMQMDRSRRHSSSLSCCQYVVRTEGVHALFVSLPTAILMNIPHMSTYWLVYESLLAYANGGRLRDTEHEDTAQFMVSGFTAGAAASVVSFPFDMAKTHLQLGHGSGFVSVMRGLLIRRGLRGIFAGVVPRIMYTAPSGAIMMVTYESTKRILTGERSLHRQ